MKKNINVFKFTFAVVIILTAMTGCLITEVDQSTEVEQNGVFTSTITVTDITADANAHEGILIVLVPNDWEFVSGTYETDGGSGSIILDTSDPTVYGDIDTTIVPPDGMKWVNLISDAAYATAANAVHEATVSFNVGDTTGDFPIGYVVTKNSTDLLPGLNLEDTDNDNAWADSSMNHMVTINPATGIEDYVIDEDYSLLQNYPNPFNPTTKITFKLAKSENVKLTIYNILGDEIATLINGYVPAGINTVNFNAANLSSGAYIYKIESESFVQTRKMVLLK